MTGENHLPREMVGFIAWRLMKREVEGLTGATATATGAGRPVLG